MTGAVEAGTLAVAAVRAAIAARPARAPIELLSTVDGERAVTYFVAHAIVRQLVERERPLARAGLTMLAGPVDRDEIERHDFPAVRRGYDTAAVDDHLRRVADEFVTLGRAAADRPTAPSLAEGASERVRAILEAAEASARELREEAGREAGVHVERVERSAADVLGKLDRLQSELDRLLSGLRSSAESLTGSLEALRGAAPAPATAPDAPPAGNGERSRDEAGARLVALNMALEGAPREQAGRFLAEHYDIPDMEGLLDDVYTSAGR